jgi:hypothetical protein
MKRRQPLPQKTAALWLLPCLVAGLFVADYARSTPYMQAETYLRVPFYATPRRAGVARELSKALNSCEGEASWGLKGPGSGPCIERARHISYLADWVDANGLVIGNRLGPWGARSLSHLLCSITIVALLAATWRALLGAERGPWVAPVALFLGAWYLTTPGPLAGNGVYFRSAKDLACVAIALAFWLVVAHRRGVARRPLYVTSAAILPVLTLADETVAAMLGLFALLEAGALWRRRGRDAALLITLATPVLFYALYSTWLAGWLEHALEGTEVTTAFRDPAQYGAGSLSTLTGVAQAFVYAAQGLLGNPWDGSRLACVAAAGALWRAGWLARHSKAARHAKAPEPLFAWYEVIVLLICLFGMYTAMSLRHAPLLWHAIWQGGYYYQPVCLLFMLVTSATAAARQLWLTPMSRAWAAVALLLLSVGNFAATPRLKETSLAEVIEPEVREQQQPLIRAMLYGETPQPGQSVQISAELGGFLRFFVGQVPARRRGIALAN